MKNVITLLKNQIKNTYKLKEEKKSTIAATVIAFIVLGVVFGFMGIGSTLLLGSAFVAKDLHQEFLTIFLTTSQLVVLIFGTIMMVSTLFYNRDNEYLSALPVTPQEVFFSKFLFVYLNELLISTAFVFMIGITFGILAGYTVWYYLSLILVAILLPLLPLLLSALLSIPIMYVLSFFKNKGIYTTILLIVVFATVFFFYFKFISVVQTALPDEDSSMIHIPDSMVPGIQNAAKILAPIYALVGVITGRGSLWLNLIIVVASFAVLLALGYILSLTAYTKGVKAQFENTRTVIKKPADYRQYGVSKSLMRMDFKEIMRNPMLAFYALFQVVFCPILMVFMGTNMGDVGDNASQQALMEAVQVMSMTFFVLLLTSSTNYTALSSFSREGQNFFYLKSLPVNPAEILKAKTLLARIITFVGIAAAVVTSFFVFRSISLLNRIGLTLFILIFSDGFTHYLVYLDFKKPKLVWENVVNALKNNMNTFISMGVMFGVLVAVLGLYAGAYFGLVMYLGAETFAVMGVYWCLMVIGAVVSNVLFRKTLYRHAETLYNQPE